MSRVKNFLTELDDFELAYFAKYKSLTYIKDTRVEIEAYLTERKLTESRIDQLIARNPRSKLRDGKIRCPRCYSDKLRKDRVEWTNTSYSDKIAVLDGLAGRTTYKYKVICNVCGLWLTDPNNEKGKPFWRTIWDFFIDLISL